MANQEWLTIEEYNQLEEEKQWGYEYLNGRVVPREEADLAHSFTASNLSNLLGKALNETEYKVLTSVAKFHIEQENVSLYPDLAVVCSPWERSEDDAGALKNPLLIVEIISDSSAAYDQGEKFNYYRKIPTLQEYVLLDTDIWHVETRLRNLEENTWQIEWFGSERYSPTVPERRSDELVLKSVGVNLTLLEVFQNADEYNNQAFKASPNLEWKRRKLLKVGAHIFGSPKSFDQWLRQPAFGLGEEIPIELLETSEGINQVWNLIWRIAYGIF